jgi:hypothetical protein
MNLAMMLDAARSEVARLEREAAAATCAELGRHDMESVGGMWCGCQDGHCSFPVNVCKRCGDSDYGQNEDAREIKRRCRERHGENDETA